jgi:P-type Ca2+ transporter type 2C
MKSTFPTNDSHTLSVDEVVHAFQTNAETGLNTTEANNRTVKYGTNVYQAQKQKSVWLVLLKQFKSPIVYLLVFGALVSVYFKEYIESVSIVVVIVTNALIGFWMEMQARSSMNALKKMDVIHSKVFRHGKLVEIASEKITLGDVVVLEAGDIIPGDGRLIETNQFQCDESSLTGESLPSEKNTEQLPKDTPLADQHNMVFKGTSVMNGNAKAVITGIATNTQLGTITSLVENEKEKPTHLDKKLNALSKKLIWITLIMTSIFAFTGIMQGKTWLLIIETSIALAVAAFPEGLPIVSTVALAYGMVLMAKRNVIVKKLSSVETLGSTSVILTDKTGTLTKNKIHVDTLSFPEETRKVQIEDHVLTFENGEIEKSKENFDKMILIGALCNNASVDAKEESGDPIEIALLHLANAKSSIELQNQYERIGEMPFNSITKMMGTLHKSAKGQLVVAKGSVEDLLKRCTKIQLTTSISELDEETRKTILSVSEKMASEGLRVLAFAYKEGEVNQEDYLNELVYVGMIGFLDPPRMDIKAAIQSCRNAGIKIVMITGDHPLTALNIAKRVGLADKTEQNVITGKELPAPESLSVEWKEKILACVVFARTTPKQKLDIADVFQKAGHIVAMTGDGINDAPALKKADVGIAMGLRGTQVAKETASIILKDDSFTSIAEAVAHGREIFQNIQKFVIYLVSCNLSEILIITSLGYLVPISTLLPLQILFLNMVTDVFPALALGVGEGDKTVMLRPPRDPEKNIVTNKSWVIIGVYAIAMTLSVILAVLYCKQYISAEHNVLNNVAFITLALAQLFHVFNMSSFQSGMLANEVTKNKYVWIALLICVGLIVLVYLIPTTRIALHLYILPVDAWIVCLVASLFTLFLGQLYKIIWGGNKKK